MKEKILKKISKLLGDGERMTHRTAVDGSSYYFLGKFFITDYKVELFNEKVLKGGDAKEVFELLDTTYKKEVDRLRRKTEDKINNYLNV